MTTGLAALAALAIGPAVAAAASPLVDDDFAGGTPGTNTVVAPPGSLQLARIMKTEPFDGTLLPAAYSAKLWDTTPPEEGSATVGGGLLTVDGARVASVRPYDAGQEFAFSATFGEGTFRHVGFGNTTDDVTPASTFANGPWAIFSTGSAGTTLRARTLTGVTGGVGTVSKETVVQDKIAGFDQKLPHDYRIVWSATEVSYYVDNQLVDTHTAVPIAGQMRPGASDATAGGGVLTVDSAGLLLYADSGTFDSRVHDAGDSRAVWGELTPAPAGTGTDMTFQTRSGNTGTPDASWSAYQALGEDGAIQSPPGRFIQYRATLSTNDDRVTPSLESVQLSYELDEAPPNATTITGVDVSGTNATLRFASTDTDVSRFECRLDSGNFAACTSPNQFSGLTAGSHTASVRAIDKVGNEGQTVSQPFTVASSTGTGNPPPTGGGGPKPPAGTPADTKAPLVSIGARSIRVSKRAAIRLKCPADETKCTISVRLKYGRKTAGQKTVTAAGGQTVKAKVLLSSAARTRLAKRGRLNVTAIVTARDAAGNSKRREFAMTLRPI
jgi:hypothetical protein